METSESVNRYYTPSYEEFHYGFKYEISTKESGYTDWEEVECSDGRSLWSPIHDTRLESCPILVCYDCPFYGIWCERPYLEYYKS